MSDLATLDDIKARWKTQLNPQEAINGQSWLTDASSILRDEIPTVDAKCAASPDYARKVAYVVAMAVIRVLRGQDPRDSAEYSTIFYKDAELASLEASSEGTALTITPSSAGPYCQQAFGAATPWPVSYP